MEIKKQTLQTIVGEFQWTQATETVKKEASRSKYVDAYEAAAKSSEIDQTKSKIEKEKEAASVQFVMSAVTAAATFGMGAGGYASAGAASAEQAEASSDDSKRKPESMKAQSELEIFQARIRKLLA